MNTISVSSSAISAIGYDGSTLVVVFHNSGRYSHRGVPEHLYLRFMNSYSKGCFYNENIRGRY